MDINGISNANFNGQENLTNTLGNTKPSKIEVVVGALTENDVKDHGTTTGVVKTVNKIKRKPKTHIVGEMKRKPNLDIKNPAQANKLVNDLVGLIKESPKEAIFTQANQVPEVVLNLLE